MSCQAGNVQIEDVTWPRSAVSQDIQLGYEAHLQIECPLMARINVRAPYESSRTYNMNGRKPIDIALSCHEVFYFTFYEAPQQERVRVLVRSGGRIVSQFFVINALYNRACTVHADDMLQYIATSDDQRIELSHSPGEVLIIDSNPYKVGANIFTSPKLRTGVVESEGRFSVEIPWVYGAVQLLHAEATFDAPYYILEFDVVSTTNGAVGIQLGDSRELWYKGAQHVLCVLPRPTGKDIRIFGSAGAVELVIDNVSVRGLYDE